MFSSQAPGNRVRRARRHNILWAKRCKNTCSIHACFTIFLSFSSIFFQSLIVSASQEHFQGAGAARATQRFLNVGASERLWCDYYKLLLSSERSKCNVKMLSSRTVRHRSVMKDDASDVWQSARDAASCFCTRNKILVRQHLSHTNCTH